MTTTWFNVTYHVGNNDGQSATFKGRIGFSRDPNTYGNGYSMYVESPAEAFGGQAYDIRYDKRFNKNRLKSYVTAFMEDRYDGKDGRWKLIGIRVWEAEFGE